MLLFYLSALDTQEERDKFAELYNEYGTTMKHTALKTLKSDNVAEDAVHEAFLKITNHINGIDDIKCAKTYNFVVMIVKDVCNDMLKQDTKIKERDESYKLEYRSSVSRDLCADEYEFKELLDKVMEMPDIYRDVLMLHVYYDLPTKKIAKLLNISDALVRKRLQRAREIMMRKLRKWNEY